MDARGRTTQGAVVETAYLSDRQFCDWLKVLSVIKKLRIVTRFLPAILKNHLIVLPLPYSTNKKKSYLSFITAQLPSMNYCFFQDGNIDKTLVLYV